MLVERVYLEYKIDKIIIVPSKKPPHKRQLIPAEHRINMLKLLFKNKPYNIEISEFEIKSEGVSYTYKTLEYYRKKYSDASISFLTGSDIFSTITTWKNWKLLFELANFIVVNRKEIDLKNLIEILPDCLKEKITYEKNIKTKFGKIYFFNMSPVEISSTEIRKSVNSNKHSEFLPEIVYNYIIKNKLYLEV
jgi:nicotinate-nucleotide adenylyltransferase